jgi:hypothetical protein
MIDIHHFYLMEEDHMSSKHAMVTLADTDRVLRLRENKRRNRQRQRDYTASLESRLRRLEADGIKATQEVQSAARKVVEDNLRLKALLRVKGVDEHTIDTWRPEGEAAVSNISTVMKQRNRITVCFSRRLAATILALKCLGNKSPPSPARKLAFGA